MNTPSATAKISACSVIFHEEELLPRVLEHTKPFVDEWIFIHDGTCEDRSIEILEEYKAKGWNIRYEIGPKIGNAEPHRIRSYELATNEWIFILDPDQFLNDALLRDIKQLVNQNEVDGYWVQRTSFDGTTHHNTGEFASFLFRKSKMWVTALPHGGVHTTGVMKYLGDPYLEYHEHIQKGEKGVIGQFKNKYYRWARVHAAYLRKEFSPELVFQAGPEVWYTKKRARLLAHPLLWSYFYLVFNFFSKYFLKGHWKKGMDGFQTAVGSGYYAYVLCMEIARQQREAKRGPAKKQAA